MDDDDEIADAALASMVEDTDDDRSPRRPTISLARWDPMAELRASMIDGLMLVARTIIMVHTPKGKRVPELRTQPRPETALERAIRRRQDAVMNDLEAQLEAQIAARDARVNGTE